MVSRDWQAVNNFFAILAVAVERRQPYARARIKIRYIVKHYGAIRTYVYGKITTSKARYCFLLTSLERSFCR